MKYSNEGVSQTICSDSRLPTSDALLVSLGYLTFTWEESMPRMHKRPQTAERLVV